MNISQPPRVTDPRFNDWLFLLWKKVNATTTESTVTSTQDHGLLTNLNSADYTHLSATQAQSLTSGADSLQHYHAFDRDRANHTGTQTSSTISDFSSAVQALVPSVPDFLEITALNPVVSARDIPDLPSGSTVNRGTVTFSFGAAPGTNLVTTTVSAPAITATSNIDVYISGVDSTAEHTGYEHSIVEMAGVQLTAVSITPGVGFTAQWASDLRLTGTFKARYAWAD